ncbi:MAG: hypothetical protein AVDCRST_MAG68-5479 [uncultured Gemmatimonadetes bacterium]|uniref:Uncharacterized protein n=1 Tax=uncultured Gemmatimonadota bacterium TaxID=203437 RepID=A0A6J4MSV7_9BACT|nr:MAG: hypothetical protein AVDCRST_MAG68-5479 [uncultured Gemmatimonadota bacterium]
MRFVVVSPYCFPVGGECPPPHSDPKAPMHLTRLSSSDTLLTYAATTSPLPLQASPAGAAPPSLGAITVVVGNNSDAPVWANRITLGITVGDPDEPESIDLTEVDGGFTVEAAGGDWTIAYAGNGRFVATPGTPQAAEFTTGGLSFTIGNIRVSTRVGTSPLDIAEHSSADGTEYADRAATVLLPKFPYGFFAGDLVAGAPSVDYGGTVRLTWTGAAAAAYTLRWDHESEDVTEVRAWTSPPLAHDTTFILDVRAQQDGETVTESFSVTVVVSNPSVVAHDLTVQNLATLHGGARVTGGATLDTLTAGDLTSNGTAQLRAAQIGRSLTANVRDLALTVGRNATLEVTRSDCVMVMANYADTAIDHCMGLYLIGPEGATMLYSTGPIHTEAGASVLTQLPTQAGPRVMASPLSPAAEVHLSGRGRLRGGVGRVDFDGPTADLMAHEAGYRVLLTAAGPCNGLYAGERDGSGFTVGECAGGTGDTGFDWLVIAPVRESLESGRPAVLPPALARRP